METYEIYWRDLTPEAQKRLKKLYHGNIDLCPLAVIDIDPMSMEEANESK